MKTTLLAKAPVFVIAALVTAYAGIAIERVAMERACRRELMEYLNQGGFIHPQRLRSLADSAPDADLTTLHGILWATNRAPKRSLIEPPAPVTKSSYRFMADISPFWKVPAYCNNNHCWDSLRIRHENTLEGLQEYVSAVVAKRGLPSGKPVEAVSQPTNNLPNSR